MEGVIPEISAGGVHGEEEEEGEEGQGADGAEGAGGRQKGDLKGVRTRMPIFRVLLENRPTKMGEQRKASALCVSRRGHTLTRPCMDHCTLHSITVSRLFTVLGVACSCTPSANFAPQA